MDDCRQNMNTLLTSTIDGYIEGMKGSTIVNYCEFRDYIKNNESGAVEGAVLYDKAAKKEFKVKCKVLVNCTGIFADEMRIKDNPEA